MGEVVARLLAVTAILPAGATASFWVFWRWFPFWRAHRFAAWALLLGGPGLLGLAVYLAPGSVLAGRLPLDPALQGAGWLLIVAACALGTAADHQLGLRVRSFGPFFDRQPGRIELRTTGAYAVVRHPIYAAGSGYQLGVLLVSGYPAVLVAWLVFTLGACWFTRQEERHLLELLEDPAGYERYRARVPALLPWPRRRSPEPPARRP